MLVANSTAEPDVQSTSTKNKTNMTMVDDNNLLSSKLDSRFTHSKLSGGLA